MDNSKRELAKKSAMARSKQQTARPAAGQNVARAQSR